MLNKEELKATAKIFESLTLYQILKVSALASEAEVRDAFHREALKFHPDRYLHLHDAEISELAKGIYAKVVQAYGTLSNRSRREDYDRSKRGKPQASVHAPSAPALKFFRLAQAAFATGNLSAAKMNIQIALNNEAENAEFLQLSQKIEAQQKKSKD